MARSKGILDDNGKSLGLNQLEGHSSILPPKAEFPVVGIGASAGGFEALTQFFKYMPPDSGICFVIVQHLDPDYVGMMPELLSRITSIPVHQVTDRMVLRPNFIFVIPPNKNLSVSNGKLYLSYLDATQGLRLPINFFLKSLAEYKQEKSIGIILSGMGSDGSEGLVAIKEQNGLTAVQDSEDAKFDGMPLSALKATQIDIVATAAALPQRLIQHFKVSPHRNKIEEAIILPTSNIRKIVDILQKQVGYDFSQYKKNTLYRRIERRMEVHHIKKIEHYVRFLADNTQEIDILYKELLIGVTSFFRDPLVWDELKNTILPTLLATLPDNSTFRAWVPACSTGEEAYSLTILLNEVLQDLHLSRQITVQIFATDIDTDAIDKARIGYFSNNRISGTSDDRLKRYFNKEQEGYRIKKELRENLIFAPHNVIQDPPYTRLNMISCRNMLIYIEPELQKRLITLFHYGLFNEGILVLGNAESISMDITGFNELGPKLKIFRRTSSNVILKSLHFPGTEKYHKTMDSNELASPHSIDNIPALTDRILLDSFAPPSVLVNEKGDIIYITGRTGKYLEPPAGKTNWNIHAMVRQPLRFHLPKAFNKALKSFEAVTIPNIRMSDAKEFRPVSVILQRLEHPLKLKGLILIIFREEPVKISGSAAKLMMAKTGSNIHELELENELQRTYNEMNTLREEMISSKEDLKALNEELQSTIEELQSSNEELTTSKEEMQSLNEELQTVNMELENRVTDFVHANDDMKNLLNSIDIATLFLDKHLCIRRFTEQATKIFKLRTGDVGRPFTDLVNELKYPNLGTDALKVIQTLKPIEKAIETTDDRWFTLRIMPYRTIDDRIDGLVLTLNDITIAKTLEIKLLQANERLTQRTLKKKD